MVLPSSVQKAMGRLRPPAKCNNAGPGEGAEAQVRGLRRVSSVWAATLSPVSSPLWSSWGAPQTPGGADRGIQHALLYCILLLKEKYISETIKNILPNSHGTKV